MRSGRSCHKFPLFWGFFSAWSVFSFFPNLELNCLFLYRQLFFFFRDEIRQVWTRKSSQFSLAPTSKETTSIENSQGQTCSYGTLTRGQIEWSHKGRLLRVGLLLTSAEAQRRTNAYFSYVVPAISERQA